MDIQRMVDVMSASWRRDRSRYHLTLGELISQLEILPPDLPVKFDSGGYPCEPHSYRGYYSDLAFETTQKPVSAGEFLVVCRNALNATFEGYKGGDFVMGPETPLWSSSYGSSGGPALVGLRADDTGATIETKRLDD